MPSADQGVSLDRYMLIPRVLIFLTRGDSVLLLKGAASKRLWANKYNGIGGHLEKGEDVISCARRELLEETGLSAELRLCGTLIVDSGENPGVGIYILTGECLQDEPVSSSEGILEWIPFAMLSDLPLVEDVNILLQKIKGMKSNAAPFAARSFYDGDRLVVQFDS
jgi:8-oxo-dGTP diphosphatase